MVLYMVAVNGAVRRRGRWCCRTNLRYSFFRDDSFLPRPRIAWSLGCHSVPASTLLLAGLVRHGYSCGTVKTRRVKGA